MSDETASDRRNSQRLENQTSTIQSLMASAANAAWLRPLLSGAFFAIALWLLHHEFNAYEAADVAASFRSIPINVVLAALFFTACNYTVMIGYDWLGVKLVKHPLSFKQVTIASLLYYAFSNSLGALFGGTPVRVRLYSGWGMTSPEIVRLIVVIATAFWVGLFSLAGLLFVCAPFDIPDRFNLPLANSRPLGIIMLILASTFFAGCALRKTPIHFHGINFQPPPLRIGLAQVGIAMCDFLFASATLFILLPADVGIGFFPFTAIFLLAIIIALISHVPGGLGVLELVFVTMLPQSSHGLVASLLAFRVIYYLVPLMIAIVSIAIASIVNVAKQTCKRRVDPNIDPRSRVGLVVDVTRVVAPRIITGAIFVAGLILLISGSLPAAEGRMKFVREAMPLPVVEISHLLGSIIGALLLILARALQRRIDAAWTLTAILLGAGIVVSLSKGFDYEEASVLAILLLALLPCRSYFYRKGSLLSPSISIDWLASIVMSLGLSIWLVLFAYRHVEYSGDLWWDFAYHGDAPRSLRALLGAAVVFTLVAVAKLLRARPSDPALPTESEFAEVESIVTLAQPTDANLALLGDKQFVFSEDRKAFAMFGCEGKSWITMGDPVGPQESADDAAWKFREACDVAGVYPVFYQVDESNLSRYIDMGLTLLKLGEEGRVPLADFSLEGSHRKDLRRTKKKSGEAGLQFKIIPRAEVPVLIPRLKVISDEWLADKPAGEKGFSLGFFNEAYLARYDIAVVTQSDQPIAFANVLRGANKQELSIDLMRYVEDAPHGVMEYLFLELMLYGSVEGYQYFSLGMAPLSGVDAHRLGSLWNRVSDLMFRHGEHFYNFQGLRAYKQKFDPEWTPKYLASPGGVSTARVLTDVTTLISGGLVKLLHH
ncbi:bifunctional lysylphosphatidylglycerol flippase/synthetase MprF [Rubripirellula reticaptiva]|uniref:Phosphatidylglycerol lysyltransferase n=1 Tax=Rubripirellula reticaptiva TaxID=2528013 RepID=A0A5C6F3H2_9BACT|nr:bifunctional lysylphosphatidylglycerol flippase/synthetase MprF [Rubripirellula reticaptiva]TWU56353.1 Phosphatidylglycerol lysyltransferase [Rubripirellula reticaptiva]